MIKETIKISGMSCIHCIKHVEHAIKELPVNKFKVYMNLLDIEYDPAKVSKEKIVAAIEEEGYEVIP
jgi:copper chaperone